MLVSSTREDPEMTAILTIPTPTPLTVRELGPHDGAVLDEVFAGLSAQSRFRRFHGATPRMTAAVRARLAAVDGRGHIAVAAFAGGAPVGIARLIVFGPGRADLAVEVVDAAQGQGIGGLLVREVVAIGAARGITEVVAEVLAENVAMRRVLAATFPHLVAAADGPEFTYVGRVRKRRSWRSGAPRSIGGDAA
jgi:GNAT superfamily N-acetyltransferase